MGPTKKHAAIEPTSSMVFTPSQKMPLPDLSLRWPVTGARIAMRKPATVRPSDSAEEVSSGVPK
ncbi:Uncharacterised protein [Mycobacterium tuberculosis]|nr:Uncharacterised protein [Mycobacterium tuberculosis]